MTLEQLKAALEETGMPAAYHHFAEGDAPQLPFLIYLVDGYDVLFADGERYAEQDAAAVELYTEYKSPDDELAVETILARLGLRYSKSEAWIRDEKMFEIRYEFYL